MGSDLNWCGVLVAVPWMIVDVFLCSVIRSGLFPLSSWQSLASSCLWSGKLSWAASNMPQILCGSAGFSWSRRGEEAGKVTWVIPVIRSRQGLPSSECKEPSNDIRTCSIFIEVRKVSMNPVRSSFGSVMAAICIGQADTRWLFVCACVCSNSRTTYGWNSPVIAFLPSLQRVYQPKQGLQNAA